MESPVLFLCIENSSRSQMAEGFARRLGMPASSAGTFPSTHVNPLVVQAMKEKGIDIAGHHTKEVTEGMVEGARLVVLTDGSLKQGMEKGLLKRMKKKTVEWSIPDPQGRPLEEIRLIRDEIERKVSELYSEQRRSG